MVYEVVLAAGAVADWSALDARRRAAVKSAIALQLGHDPTKVSRSRIKRLRGLRRPQYRLRVEATRVFYDVDEGLCRVEVLRIIAKHRADDYLVSEGVLSEEDTAVEGQG
jgi:mRNA-degrading endonuclease RelE of RelBE toxin-antitoxin system